MTQTQYKAALKRLGLTHQAAAEFLGISLRTCSGYANGSPIPESVAKLLRIMIKLKLNPDKIEGITK